MPCSFDASLVRWPDNKPSSRDDISKYLVCYITQRIGRGSETKSNSSATLLSSSYDRFEFQKWNYQRPIGKFILYDREQNLQTLWSLWKGNPWFEKDWEIRESRVPYFARPWSNTRERMLTRIYPFNDF